MKDEDNEKLGMYRKKWIVNMKKIKKKKKTKTKRRTRKYKMK